MTQRMNQLMTSLGCGILVVLMTTGCNSKRDAQISDLEDQVILLKTEINRLRRDVDGAQLVASNAVFMALSTGESADRDMTKIFKQMREYERQSAETLAVLKENLDVGKRAPAPARPRVAPAQALAPAPVNPLKNGIPATVYDDIARTAASKWPGNFEMQEYVIREQVGSYKRLNGLK